MSTDPLESYEVDLLKAAQLSAPRDHNANLQPVNLKFNRSVGLPPPVRSVPLLQARSSSREVTTSLSIQDLTDFLAALGGPGARAYARSGGLEHSQLLLLASLVNGLDRGAYWVVSPEQLQQVDLGGLLDALLMKICTYIGLGWDTPPAATFLLLTRWHVLTSKYRNCTLHAGLLDAGVLLATMQLAATAIGFPSTPCAAVAPFAVSNALGLADHDEMGHLATFCLGGIPKNKGES